MEAPWTFDMEVSSIHSFLRRQDRLKGAEVTTVSSSDVMTVGSNKSTGVGVKSTFVNSYVQVCAKYRWI